MKTTYHNIPALPFAADADVARCSQYNEAKVGTEITEGENELWL